MVYYIIYSHNNSKSVWLLLYKQTQTSRQLNVKKSFASPQYLISLYASLSLYLNIYLF